MPFNTDSLNAGDTAWMLMSAALVMFMTPGLALFYGGMVRSKNILGMLMQNFFSLGLIAVLWAVIGYSLAFGGDAPLIGNFEFFGLKDVATMYPPDPSGVEWFGLFTFPPIVFMAYQGMFAIITPALITGAIADRMKFSAWVWFLGLWSILVYSPVAHWVFSPAGWLFERGALDFAGGTVVHINAGIAALACVLVLGKRKGWPNRPMPPHMLPLTLIGSGILWFGWFGFNAGSAGAANMIAGQAFSNTNLAAAAAMLGWLLIERIKTGHATTLGAASGARRRSRGDHAVRRVRRRHLADHHRRHRRRRVLPGDQHEDAVRLRRLARRRRRAPRRWRRRLVAVGVLRRPGDQRAP